MQALIWGLKCLLSMFRCMLGSVKVWNEEDYSSSWKLVYLYNQMYCSREYQLTSRFNQQYEKSTSNFIWVCMTVPVCYILIPCTLGAHIHTISPRILHGSLWLTPLGNAALHSSALLLRFPWSLFFIGRGVAIGPMVLWSTPFPAQEST